MPQGGQIEPVNINDERGGGREDVFDDEYGFVFNDDSMDISRPPDSEINFEDAQPPSPDMIPPSFNLQNHISLERNSRGRSRRRPS